MSVLKHNTVFLPLSEECATPPERKMKKEGHPLSTGGQPCTLYSVYIDDKDITGHMGVL
jgi:hypothetical protein